MSQFIPVIRAWNGTQFIEAARVIIGGSAWWLGNWPLLSAIFLGKVAVEAGDVERFR